MRASTKPNTIAGRRPRGLISTEASMNRLRERPDEKEKRIYVCRTCGAHQDDDARCKYCGGRIFGYE